MGRLVFLIWIFIASAAFAAVSQEDEIRANRDDIIRLLGQIPEFAPIRQELQSLGFQGENLDLAVEHAELIYRDPVIAGYVADQVIEAFLNPQNAGVAGGLIWPLVERGLGHLPTRELLYYYRVEKSLIGALPTRQCGMAVRNKLREERFAELTSRAAAKLSTRALRDYYRIQAKAARLGVEREPIILSTERIAALEAMINADIRQRIMRTSKPRPLLRALKDLDKATNVQACAIGKLFLDAVLEMEGSSRRDALIFMSLP